MRKVLHCDRCGKFIEKGPAAMSKNSRYCSEECRFMGKVQVGVGEDACWQWQGAKHAQGYGHFRQRNFVSKASRASYQMFVAEIPDGLIVCHSCDNAGCVNPAHLFLGTNQDNMEDRNKKGRQARGERHSRAILTEEEAMTIRASKLSGRKLAEAYGVAYATIFSIKQGRTWRHI